MIILTIRTDKPEAEIGLYEGSTPLAYTKWQAHRELAETLHTRLKELLEQNGKELKDLQAIVVYKGPGSFTGLRIGISVANAFAKSLNIPIAGTIGDDWIGQGIKKLLAGEDQALVMPEYGALPNITKPKH